jgi:hypothetical protein
VLHFYILRHAIKHNYETDTTTWYEVFLEHWPTWCRTPYTIASRKAEIYFWIIRCFQHQPYTPHYLNGRFMGHKAGNLLVFLSWCQITKIKTYVIIHDELSLRRPVSVSSTSLFKGLPGCLRPFGL